MKEKTSLYDWIPMDDIECDPLMIHVYDWTGTEIDHYVKAVCSRPWCHRCEPMRVWKLQRKIMKYLEWHYKLGRHYWIVTRSVRNEPEMVSSFNTLRDAQRKFSRVSKFKDHPFRDALAWVATTEIKHSATGYNVHEHMIWVTEDPTIDFVLMHKYWDRAAGFVGAHINIKKVNDPRHATNYVAKYLAKGIWGGLSTGRAYLCREALKGRNRINTKRGTLPEKNSGTYTYCCSTEYQKQCTNEGMSGVKIE